MSVVIRDIGERDEVMPVQIYAANWDWTADDERLTPHLAQDGEVVIVENGILRFKGPLVVNGIAQQLPPRVVNGVVVDDYCMQRMAAQEDLGGTDHGNQVEEVDLRPYMTAPRIAMPPGYWMERIATTVFFFSPRTVDRVFGESVADYRHEMIKAEAKGASSATLRKLRLQHWGGFFIALVEELAGGVVGKIVKVLKGG